MAHFWWAIRMRDLRAALVSISPLLTDLIRHALMNRVPIAVIAESADPRELERVANTIDVILLGSPVLLQATQAVANAEILLLSDDLTELRRPPSGRSMPLSSENLITALREIAEDLDLRSRSNPDP
jgi:hypothetical protein